MPSRIGLRVLERLGENSGAVIEDGTGAVLYWLVRPGAADKWELPQPSVGICGATSYVAVPPVTWTEEHRLRWIVPLTPLRYLTDPELLYAALAVEIDAAIGPRPSKGSATTDQPPFAEHAVLLPCEPCFGARIFGGRHACTGTSDRGLLGRRIIPVQPEPCPCDHQPPHVRLAEKP